MIQSNQCDSFVNHSPVVKLNLEVDPTFPMRFFELAEKVFSQHIQ